MTPRPWPVAERKETAMHTYLIKLNCLGQHYELKGLYSDGCAAVVAMLTLYPQACSISVKPVS